MAKALRVRYLKRSSLTALIVGAMSVATAASGQDAPASGTATMPVAQTGAGTPQDTGSGTTSTGPIAQNTAPAPDNGDIIVTAERTSEVASKVPQALSVFSGSQLKEAGITNVRGLQELTPGLQIGEATRGVQISIRGVQATDQTSKGRQDIVTSIDDVPIGQPQLVGMSFFDIERVEVLRGPQGTLYGLSSTGGAINIITAKPKNEFEASADAELSNFDTRRFNAMVNVPVTDDFAIRAAATSNTRDGWIKPVLTVPGLFSSPQRDLNGLDNWAARLTGKWDFSHSGSLTVTGSYARNTGTNDSGTVLYNRVYNANGDDRFKVFNNPLAGDYGLNERFLNINAELAFDVGPAHVVYDAAHQWSHFNDDNNVSVNSPAAGAPGGTPDAAVQAGNYGTGSSNWERYSSHLTTDSHELRVSNADPLSRLAWLLGANYYREYNNEADVEWQTVRGGTCEGQLLEAACSGNPNPQIFGPNIHRSVGVFGQLGYNVTDKLKIIGGLRYSQDKSARYAVIAAGPAPGPAGSQWLTASGVPCSPLAGPCDNPAQVSPDTGVNETSAVTYRAALDYQMTPSDLFYASISSGYKGGGFNDVDPTASTRQTGLYGAEHVTAYEVGFKGRLAPGLRYSTSAYYYDYSDYQLTGATFLAISALGQPGVLIYTTLAPATMYGWENQVTWQATSNDTLTFTFSAEQAHFDKGPNAARVGFIYSNQVNFGGKSLPLVPDYSGTVTYEHRWNLANGGDVRFRAFSWISNGYFVTDYSGAGNPFSGVYTSPPQEYRQHAYTRTDLSVDYTGRSGSFSIGAFVRNVENKVQMQNAPLSPQTNQTQAVSQTVQVNEPRTYGVRMGVRF